MPIPIDHLRDLQKWKGPKGRAAIPSDSIRKDVSQLKSTVERHAQRFGNAAELWEQFIPDNIRSDTRLSGLSAGVLTVVTSSASTSYALDRLLRSGVEDEIRQASRGKITRVRMRVGQVNQ